MLKVQNPGADRATLCQTREDSVFLAHSSELLLWSTVLHPGLQLPNSSPGHVALPVPGSKPPPAYKDTRRLGLRAYFAPG